MHDIPLWLSVSLQVFDEESFFDEVGFLEEMGLFLKKWVLFVKVPNLSKRCTSLSYM